MSSENSNYSHNTSSESSRDGNSINSDCVARALCYRSISDVSNKNHPNLLPRWHLPHLLEPPFFPPFFFSKKVVQSHRHFRRIKAPIGLEECNSDKNSMTGVKERSRQKSRTQVNEGTADSSIPPTFAYYTRLTTPQTPTSPSIVSN